MTKRPPVYQPPAQAAASFRGWAGKSFGWRYYAQRIDGSGPAGVFLHNELRLQDVSIERVLSGPNQLTATISPTDLTVVNPDTASTEPLILPERGTLVHAEFNGDIMDSFLLMGVGMNGPTLSLDCSGLTTVAKNLTYPGVATFVETDPLFIIRHLWQTIQTQQDSNIGLIVDPYTKTDRRVGHEPAPVQDSSSSSEGTVSTGSDDDKPFELNWWSTHDMGGVIDKLAEENSIEYRVRSFWNADQSQVNHYLEFGYPAIGQRRTDIRFIVGENIQVMPPMNRSGNDYVNEVNILGAGEGSAMIRGYARRRDGRVRTSITLDEKSITDVARANRVAALELARRQQLTQISDIVIRNTGLAPLNSFGPGDEIRVAGNLDWGDFDVWARITSLKIDPDNPNIMQASIQRTDWY